MWKWVLGIVAVGLAALAAASWALWSRWNRDPLAEAPGYLHEGADAIAVSPDGDWVVTRDGNGGLRAFETATGRVVTPPTAPRNRGVVVCADLAFTSDGILIGVPWSRQAPDGFLGLRAGTWEAVVVPAAPRKGVWIPEPGGPQVPDWDSFVQEARRRLAAGAEIDCRPPGFTDVPAVDCVLPGGRILGRYESDEDFGVAEWTASTGAVVREWAEGGWDATIGGAFPDARSVAACQYGLFARIDLDDGRLLWQSDPFETGRSLVTEFERDSAKVRLAASEEALRSGHVDEVVGIARQGTRVVGARRRMPRFVSRRVEDDSDLAAADLETRVLIVVLDGGTGAKVWSHELIGWVLRLHLGPDGTTLLVCTDGRGRLLDLTDGRDVTPPGWPRGRLSICAAAPDPDGRALWVALRDGRVRRLEVPPVAR